MTSKSDGALGRIVSYPDPLPPAILFGREGGSGYVLARSVLGPERVLESAFRVVFDDYGGIFTSQQ